MNIYIYHLNSGPLPQLPSSRPTRRAAAPAAARYVLAPLEGKNDQPLNKKLGGSSAGELPCRAPGGGSGEGRGGEGCVYALDRDSQTAFVPSARAL